jgi:hypothetical protein
VTNELSLIKKDQRKKHFIAQVSNEIRQGANFKIEFTKRRVGDVLEPLQPFQKCEQP